jgi:hypothetical protein
MLETKLHKLFKFSPLVLILLSLLLDKDYILISRLLKMISFIGIIAQVFIYKNKSIFLYFGIFLFFYLLFLTFYNNIYLYQALEDGFRYFIPISALVYGSIISKYKKEIIIILLSFIILNDLFQVMSFLIKPLFFPNYGYHLYRAKGLLSFFDFFGFINLIGVIILNEFKYKFKFKYLLLILFLLSIFWSISYKMILITVLYLFLRNIKLLSVFLLVTPILYFYKTTFVNDIVIRMNRYILVLDSTRAESYRIIFNNFSDFLLLGKGPGVFGGPASTKYNSYFYKLYNFDWHYSYGMSTTDTYYPHLFVELGFVIALLYLFIIFIIPTILTKGKIISIIIILVLAINSIFTFSLNSFDYCFFSLILVFLEGEQIKK